jgi:arsenate reductase (glutaredoxin)
MKKAFAWLEGNGIEYQLHDYKKAGVPADKMQTWIDRTGWEALVNTRGPTFRQLPAARQQGLNAARAKELMIEFPSLIRRPVIEAGNELLIGFDPDRYQVAFGKADRAY